jgi:hypothetical protein
MKSFCLLTSDLIIQVTLYLLLAFGNGSFLPEKFDARKQAQTQE